MYFRVFLLMLSISQHVCANSPLADAQQLILVVTRSWDDYKGKMDCFERNSINSKWIKIKDTKDVVVGTKGMGWGKGLYSYGLPGPTKHEGDYKSPAGIFSFGSSFGHTNSKFIDNKLEYIEITPTTEAIDDPMSAYYNKIIRREDILTPDWISSEKMGLISVYLRGIVINHNTTDIDKTLGSQIFMHIWQSSEIGTAGCTGLSPEDMDYIFHWLDQNKNPRIVQLPREIFDLKAINWQLPNIYE